MKGQISLEFLTILLILVSYLGVVFTLFSSAKSSLESAVDRKTADRIENWISFIGGRPEGSEIRTEVAPYPKRGLEIKCGQTTRITAPSGAFEVGVFSECAAINLSGKTCLSIRKSGEGVHIEVC